MLTSGLLFSQLRTGGCRYAPRALQRSSVRTYSLLAQRQTPLHATRIPLLNLSSRFKSTEATAAPAPTPDSSSLPVSDVSAASDAPTSLTDSISEAASSVAETITTSTPGLLQYGDLAALGLAGWSPAGIIRWSFELINVTTELPWFWTIVAGSVLWRLVLVPITVKGLKNSSRLLPIQPQIQIHQANIEKAKAKKDTIALQSEALKMQKLYKEAGVNLFAGILVPAVQVPVSLGLFFGVRELCNKVPQLSAFSGLDILPNMAVPDPYYVLPTMLCAVINTQIIAGAAEMNTTGRPEAAHLLNVFRILSIAGIYIMSGFPSGLMVALITTSGIATLQSFALRAPAVRRALGINPLPQGSNKLPSMKETVFFAKDWYKNKIAEARTNAEAAQRLAQQQKFQPRHRK